MPSPREQSYAETVGTNIKKIRHRKNLTQLQLSLRMSVDKSTISRNEHGDGLTVDVIPECARALGCGKLEILDDCYAAKPIMLDPVAERAERIRRLPDKDREDVLRIIDSLLSFRSASGSWRELA